MSNLRVRLVDNNVDACEVVTPDGDLPAVKHIFVSIDSNDATARFVFYDENGDEVVETIPVDRITLDVTSREVDGEKILFV